MDNGKVNLKNFYKTKKEKIVTKIILTLAMLLTICTPLSAYKQTDNMCFNQCTSNGFSYSYCTKKCTYDLDNNSGNFKIHSDLKCFEECYRDGKSAEKCRDLCN